MNNGEQFGHAITSKNDDLCCNPKVRLTGTAHYQSATKLSRVGYFSQCSAGVGALRYKPEGRGSDSRWFCWNFSLT